MAQLSSTGLTPHHQGPLGPLMVEANLGWLERGIGSPEGTVELYLR